MAANGLVGNVGKDLQTKQLAAFGLDFIPLFLEEKTRNCMINIIFEMAADNYTPKNILITGKSPRLTKLERS